MVSKGSFALGDNFYVIRNELHGYDCYYSHLTTKIVSCQDALPICDDKIILHKNLVFIVIVTM